MRLSFTKDEVETLKEVFTTQIEADTDLLKNVNDFSYGDALRFIDKVKNMKSVLRKLRKANANKPVKN